MVPKEKRRDEYERSVIWVDPEVSPIFQLTTSLLVGTEFMMEHNGCNEEESLDIRLILG